MSFIETGHRRELLAAAAWLGMLGALVAALRPLRDDLEPGTAALILLVAPLAAAMGSLRLTIVAAPISALTFNYFFTEPFESFDIESDTSITAFVVYLLIGLAFGVFAHELRRSGQVSERRAAEATLLRDLTIDLVRQSVWLQPPVASALNDLVRTLDLQGAAIGVQVAEGERFIARAGQADAAVRAVEVFERPNSEAHVRTLRDSSGLTIIPVASGTDAYGLLAVDPRHGTVEEIDERVARLFANVVALACERSTLAQASIHRRALEETDRLRTTLMQSVTHDLRTPLASISALASAIGASGSLTEEQEELIGSIHDQSARLARLVDQVLDLSRIEGGVLKPRLETLAVDDLIHSAVDASHIDGDDVLIALAPDLPPIPVDEPLIQQVLVNLIGNARSHGAPPFEIRARRTNDHVELAIVDHGRGVPEAERRRLFDPTSAMRRPSADERSRGLGLAVSAGFVEAHRGHLRVEPTPGGGATFIVSLPIASRTRT